MPRDGSNIYNIPPGTHGAPNTTIQSAPYNAYVDDVAQDLNNPRPIVAGGTGANNAVDAMVNLSGEISHQQIVNFDQDPMYSGSFYSLVTATNPPVSAHAFAGWIYKTDNDNIVIQARDASDTSVPGRLYVREKKGNPGTGVWGPWKLDGRTILGNAEGFTVDDMFFGVRTLSTTSEFIVNDKGDATGNDIFQAWKTGQLVFRPLPNENLEVRDISGTLTIGAYKDDLTTTIPLNITGSLVRVPTPATADNSTSAASTAYVKSNLANYLPLTGGTISGDVTANTFHTPNWIMIGGGTGIVYLNGANANRYLQFDGSNYHIPNSYIYNDGAAGRLWGSNDFANPGAPGNSGFISNGRLAFAGDFSHTSTMQEPYPGACCTGQSIGTGALSTRYRWVQLYTTGWFTVGTA